MDCCHNFLLNTISTTFSFWDQRFITAIGIIIGLVTFIIENRRVKIAKLKTIRENWFLTIIVQPNLIFIDKFYEEVLRNVIDSITVLKSNKSIPLIDYIVIESSEIVKFTEIRRKFMNNFVYLVRGHSKKLSFNINEIINKLNDEYTIVLDNIDHNPNVDLKDIENNIWENKSSLIEALFKSLRKG